MSPLPLGILALHGAGGGAGAYDLLETQILTSSASSVEFTGLGSYSDYKHLQLRMMVRGDRSGVADINVDMQVNSDTGSNYAWHRLIADNTDVSSFGTGSQTKARLGTGAGSNATTNSFGSFIVDILDFASMSKNTTFRSSSGLNTGTSNFVQLVSSVWLNTNAVTTLAILPESNNFITGSRFSLYGIKGA